MTFIAKGHPKSLTGNTQLRKQAQTSGPGKFLKNALR